MTRKDKKPVLAILKNTPEFTPPEVILADEVIDSYLFNPARFRLFYSGG